jgi:hypothetical protein
MRNILKSATLLLALSTSLVTAVATSSCSSSEPASDAPKAGTSGAYRGLLTGPAETGVLDVTLPASGTSATTSHPLAAPAPAAVTGTISLVGGGGSISLTGSYDPATGTLTLSGTTSRGTYSLTGTSTGSGFSGTYSGPNGSGSFSLASAASGAVVLYCGTYSLGSTVVGVFNLLVDPSGKATGAHCDAKSCGALAGTVTGGKVEIYDVDKPDRITRGTQSGNSIGGTIPGSPQDGSFQGSTDACGVVVSDAGVRADAGDPPAPGDAGADVSAPAPKVPETLAASLSDPVDLAVDATHVYVLAGGASEIRRCPAAGACAAPELVVKGLSVPSSVAAASGSVFWTNGFRTIMKCSSASMPCTGATFADLGASTYPAHLYVNGANLYWIQESGQVRQLRTCPIAGCAGDPKIVYASVAGQPVHGAPIAGLVVDGTNAYFSSFTGGVTRYSMTGPDAVDAASGTSISQSPYTTSGLDLDGTTLRWGVLNDGKVRQCTGPACTEVTDFVTGQAAPGGTRANATYVYGFNRGQSNGSGGYVASTGSLWRVTK